MSQLGNKIAQKRKTLGMTQIDFAEKLSVTRQTVSRWESGAVMPDIDKIGDIAALLGVSCDYLLRDDAQDEAPAEAPGVSRLLLGMKGQRVRLNFFDEEGDYDLSTVPCTILDFEGNWMKVAAETKKGHIEKLIPVSTVLSMEAVKEAK